MPAKSLPVSASPIAFPELMTADQLAAFLQVPRTYISEKTRYRSSNPIPAVRLGARTLRFRMTDVQVWMTQQTGTLEKPRRYKRVKKNAAQQKGRAA